MSFTVICIATTLGSSLLAIGLGLAPEDFGLTATIPALIFGVIAVVSLIFGVASYNENTRETKGRERVACVESGNEVIRYSAVDYCVAPGSKIIRAL